MSLDYYDIPDQDYHITDSKELETFLTDIEKEICNIIRTYKTLTCNEDEVSRKKNDTERKMASVSRPPITRDAINADLGVPGTFKLRPMHRFYYDEDRPILYDLDYDQRHISDQNKIVFNDARIYNKEYNNINRKQR